MLKIYNFEFWLEKTQNFFLEEETVSEDSMTQFNFPYRKENFPKSLVNDRVWRVGEVKDSPKGGGIWFAETQDGAEKFSISVRKKNEKAFPYYINLENPYRYDGFWYGYLKDVEKRFAYDRESLMRFLKAKGHDGIIIDTDTWNDTGDEYSVTSKQYVVFDPKNVNPA